MVPRNIFIAVVGASLLAWSGLSIADEYRPDEFLGLDLSRAVLSPKPLGPGAGFAPGPLDVSIARGKNGLQARTEPTAEPKTAVHGTRVAAAAAQHASNEARPSPAQPARGASLRRADSGLALQIGRHLQLEAVGGSPRHCRQRSGRALARACAACPSGRLPSQGSARHDQIAAQDQQQGQQNERTYHGRDNREQLVGLQPSS